MKSILSMSLHYVTADGTDDKNHFLLESVDTTEYVWLCLPNTCWQWEFISKNAAGESVIYFESFFSKFMPPADGNAVDFLPKGAGTNDPDQESLCRKKWLKTSAEAEPTIENDDRGDPDNCTQGDFEIVMEKTGSFFEVLRGTIATIVTDQDEVTK